MDPNITKRNELLAQKVIKGLKSRNMTGWYAPDRAAALCLAPHGASGLKSRTGQLQHRRWRSRPTRGEWIEITQSHEPS